MSEANDNGADESPPETTSSRSDNGADGPTVELGLYELAVSVDGGPEDDLADVEETASSLLEFLVEQHEILEDGPDDRDRF